MMSHRKAHMKSAFFLFAGGVLAGCAAQLPAPILSEASDPNIATSPVAYQPVISGYASERPAEPGDWLELNRQVAPEGREQ